MEEKNNPLFEGYFFIYRFMNKYYVYAYLDPKKSGEFIYGSYKFDNEPFYIGKGCGSRYLRHLKCNEHNHIKNNKINKIKSSGDSPIIIKILEKLIGRKCNKTGPLTNYHIGGQVSTKYLHKDDYKKKLMKPVTKYDLDGNKLEEYSSVGESGIKNNTHTQTISMICNGGIKIFKNKFIFKYSDQLFVERVRNKKEYPILKIDQYGGIEEYRSIKEASDKTGSTESKINGVCIGNRFTTNGYFFRYISHPKLESFNLKIDSNFGKYLNLTDKKLNYNGIEYFGILNLINSTRKIINNIFHKVEIL